MMAVIKFVLVTGLAFLMGYLFGKKNGYNEGMLAGMAYLAHKVTIQVNDEHWSSEERAKYNERVVEEFSKAASNVI